MSNVLSEEKKQQVIAHWESSDGLYGGFSAVPQDLFIFIGVCEFTGGVGQQRESNGERYKSVFGR